MAQTEILDNNQEIIDCIDRGLSRFGQSVGSVVYWKFQFATTLSKQDVAKRPDLLSKAIREIFKDGAKIIEKAIVEELKIKFQLPDRNHISLEDAINSIKAKCSSEITKLA